MNDVMYGHQVARHNIRRLRELGYAVIEPDAGDLACGRKGQGRLAATGKILARLETLLKPQDLAGKTILITAGPTREYLDPVRFISNASSGRMGYALAEAAASRGAKVILISGPTALQVPAGIKAIQVETTAEMAKAVQTHFKKCDVFIAAAAPADFSPKTRAKTKLPKRHVNTVSVQMTPDILAWVGHHKKAGQTVIGFALESPATVQKALKKLESKNADAIVLNGPENVAAEEATGTLVTARKQSKLKKKDKLQFAHALLDALPVHADA